QSVVVPWPRFEVALAVVAVTLVSMILGLLISALISNADRGMPLLVVVVMAELILCGGMFPVKDRIPLEQLSWLSPSRWAYAMAASTVDLNDLRRTAGGDQDPMWDYDVSSWLIAAGGCAAQALLLVLLITVRLRRMGPQRRARK
ncbi:ABC transporter permease, partial [Mycobacterium sp. MS3]